MLLFCEKKPVVDGANLRRDVSSVFIVDYLEDESGDELSNKRMAEVLTGSPNAIMFRAGVKQHTIDYTLSKKRPIPINRTLLSQDDLKVLGYFARDLREVVSSAFYKDGPGKLTSSGANAPSLSTAVTDDEIRSCYHLSATLYKERACRFAVGQAPPYKWLRRRR